MDSVANGGFGHPPEADETKRVVEERIEERSQQGLRETFTVTFREKPTTVEIIDIEIDRLYLNPGTHRVRAQLEHNREGELKLKEDPWSEAGQAYLRALLMAKPANPDEPDPDFDKLKEDLRDVGQNDAGLITRSGILVDGNTRAVALRELGKRTMRVGVLPESSNWEDIATVELGLQMRLDKRRDYTYINRLLAYEEMHERGIEPAVIARPFRVKVKTVERDLWVLGELRDLIERSRIGKNSLRLMDFEEDQEKLRELHRAYEDLKKKSFEKAEAMKENRLAALVLKFPKTDLRLIEDDFQGRYLERHLPEEVKAEVAEEEAGAAESVDIPGLGVAVAPSADSREAGVQSAKRLTDMLLQDRAKEKATGLGEGDPAASQRLKAVRKAINSSLKLAGSGARVKKQAQAAADRVLTAAQEIQQCSYELVQSRAKNAFDVQAFDDALIELREGLHKLAAQASKVGDDSGEGIDWLLEAAKKGRA